MSNSLASFACFNTTLAFSNQIWISDDVMASRVPVLTLQIAYNILVSRLLYYFLKPLHVPIFVAEILAGFTLSPLLLGGIPQVFTLIYHQDGILPVETFQCMGIMYYVFLSGLEMNFDTILRSKKKATSIAVGGIVVPMLMGVGFFALQHKIQQLPQELRVKTTAEGYLFWCLALSVTGFPVLARILAELKLIYTRLGKDALTAAMYIDAYGWVLFTLLIPYSHSGGKPFLSALSTMVFIIFCFCVVRPILTPFIERKTNTDSWDRPQLMAVLMGTFVCAFITDFLGTHHIVGAFIYGLILPHGRFAELVMEMTDDFVTGVLSPIYFAGFGFKINLIMIVMQPQWHLLLLIMLLLSVPKVISSLITTFFFGMSARDGLGIGLLLNTKGIMALILLSVAWDRKILNLYDFTSMMLGIIIMTVLVSPLINAIYKPKFRYKQSQLRTVQKLRSDAVLRVVACVHNARQATAMTRVLEAVNATRISPLHVFALHLVELTRHGTALLVAQMEHSNSHGGGATNPYESQAEFESITNTFEEFVKGYNAVRFETTSVLSTYETIHEDIYNVAEEKFASLIILPFHKELNSEGVLETTNTTQSDININVLQQSPCSVGIFVDRGLGSLLQTSLRIVVIFIGGPDDREALSIAWRMAGHSGIQLDVVRVLLLGEAKEEEEENTTNDDANELLCTVMDNGIQKQMDDEYILSFRHKAMNNSESIVYSEEEVHTATGEEIPLILNELDKNEYDLYIVGQSCGRNSRVFSKLMEWCDNPELGVVGDIVASASFATRASLLVVQQYDSGSKRRTQHQKKCDQKNDGSEMML